MYLNTNIMDSLNNVTLNFSHIDFAPILINLVSNSIWVALGVIATLCIRYIYIVLPTKRLWGIVFPEKTIICTSTVKTDTGEYTRPATGIGQLKAITYLVTSLNKAYKKIDFKNILYSEEEIKQNIENDLILLGGPKNNQITKLFFERFDFHNIVLQNINGVIYWQETNQVFKGEIINGKVTKDYGLIVRMDNIFSSSRKTRLILFSGCHTYGTIAAARFFCECFPKEINKKDNYILLISCDVIDGYPIKIKLEKKILLNRKKNENSRTILTKQNRENT
jgi:hypothetical protein